MERGEKRRLREVEREGEREGRVAVKKMTGSNFGQK